MSFIVGTIIKFLGLIELVIFVDAIMSWFMKPRSNELSRTLGIIVDPILKPCHKLQARFLANSPIDFSPLIALLVIELVKTVISII